MSRKKIVCLGGGSRYFIGALCDMTVVKGLARSEIIIYDIDEEKAAIMAQLGTRLAKESQLGMTVRASKTLADAVEGADFAVSSIGGAGVSVGGVYGTATHVQDMLIPARYGIYQVVGDTGGPAGMMMGLRSIPIYINICREMEKRCPEVIFLNHSNPMAVLCRAMAKYTHINVIGICHGVQGGIMRIAEILKVNPHELDCVWIGTNHYHWFMRIRHKGRDVYPTVRGKLQGRKNPKGERMTQKLSRIYGHEIVYPPDDHAFEFYPFNARLSDVEEVPYGFGKELKEEYARLEKMASVKYSRVEVKAQREDQLKRFADELEKIRPPHEPSDPLTGEGLASLMEAIALARRQVQIVNIANNGAVPNLPNYANLELEAVTDSCGVRGIYIGEAPMSLKGILEKRIAWQELVADAGVKGDRNLALQALLLDEMAILPEKAERMLSELLTASKGMLPQF